jgi:pimeloyl-ACP methyl ester carboxylesterase
MEGNCTKAGVAWLSSTPLRCVAPLHRVNFLLILLDLYGRGYSDAPQMTYDPNLYTIQLALLMQHLRWDKAAIVGVSMGGGIAAAFTAQFPHLVNDKVVLIASAGLMETSDISRTAKFMSSPLIQTLASSTPVRVRSSSLVACLNLRLIFRNTFNVLPTAQEGLNQTLLRRCVVTLFYFDFSQYLCSRS